MFSVFYVCICPFAVYSKAVLPVARIKTSAYVWKVQLAGILYVHIILLERMENNIECYLLAPFMSISFGIF